MNETCLHLHLPFIEMMIHVYKHRDFEYASGSVNLLSGSFPHSSSLISDKRRTTSSSSNRHHYVRHVNISHRQSRVKKIVHFLIGPCASSFKSRKSYWCARLSRAVRLVISTSRTKGELLVPVPFDKMFIRLYPFHSASYRYCTHSFILVCMCT
jgi:hypothetical protein